MNFYLYGLVQWASREGGLCFVLLLHWGQRFHWRCFLKISFAFPLNMTLSVLIAYWQQCLLLVKNLALHRGTKSHWMKIFFSYQRHPWAAAIPLTFASPGCMKYVYYCNVSALVASSSWQKVQENKSSLSPHHQKESQKLSPAVVIQEQGTNCRSKSLC